MALDALWAVLNPGVSQVSGVQAPVYAGFADTPAVLPEVSQVSGAQGGEAGAAVIGGSDTPDTTPENVRYQAKPNSHAGCTLDTPDTSCRYMSLPFSSFPAAHFSRLIKRP